MTLQEVMNQIPQKKWSTRVPSVALMLEQDSPVFYDALDDETSAAIYSSGFVLFQKGEHATVFPLHDCKDYVYRTVEEEIVVPFSEFADQPWQIRICMEGKDRLVHNMNNCKTGRTVSIDAYDSDDLWAEFSDLGHGDPLNTLVQQNYLKIVVMDQLSALMKIVCDKKRLLENAKKRYENPGSIFPLERNIHRLEEKEKEIEDILVKAYMDFADDLLDEEEYLSVKSKYTVEKDSIAVKKKEFSQKLVLTKQSVEQYLALAERFEALGNTADFDAPLVRELVNRIVVSKDRRIELVLNFQDVFQDELISEYLEDIHDTDTSILFETV